MLETVVISLCSALVGGSVPAWWNARHAVAAESRAVRRVAAADLAQPLRQMRMLLRQHGRVPVERSEVAAAISDWDRGWDRHGHLLPPRWKSVNRSVREAFATVFGAVALADVHPNLRNSDLEDPNYTWQEFGDEYLAYASDAVLRWGESNPPTQFLDFDTWLRATERHDPGALGWRD